MFGINVRKSSLLSHGTAGNPPKPNHCKLLTSVNSELLSCREQNDIRNWREIKEAFLRKMSYEEQQEETHNVH